MTHLGGRTWRVVDDATIAAADDDGGVEVTMSDDPRPISVDQQVADGLEEALDDDNLELWIGRIQETRFANALSLDTNGSVRLYGNCAQEVWGVQLDEFLDDRGAAIEEETPADVIRTLMADQHGDLADEYDNWLYSSDSSS
jgi:hypothetical protein